MIQLNSQSFYKSGTIFLFILVFANPHLFSQNYSIKTIPVNNNKGSTTVAKELLYQDKGTIWYATYGGIVKQTSGGSTLYKLGGPDETVIRALLYASTNLIWICSTNGVCSLDPKSGEVNWLPLDLKCSSVIETDTGDLWFGSYDSKIIKYSKEGKLKTIEVTNEKMSSSPYWELYVKDITDNGELILKNHDGTIFYGNINDGSKDTLALKEIPIEIDKKNKVILTKKEGLFPVKKSGRYTYNGILYQYDYIENIERQIIEIPFKSCIDVSKKYFFASNSIHLVALDNTHKDILFLKINKDDPNKVGLEIVDKIHFDTRITNYILDDNGIIIHHYEGISKIVFNQSGFKYYLTNKISGSELSVSSRGLIETVDKTLYIQTTSRGLMQLPIDGTSFSKVTLKNVSKENSYDDPLLYDNYEKIAVYNILKKNDSTFWAYGFFPELIKIDIKKKTYERIPIPKTLYDDRLNIRHIEPYGLDNFLISYAATNRNGILNYTISTNQFEEFNLINNKIDLTTSIVRNIFYDPVQEVLWIGTNNNQGIYKLDIASDTLMNIPFNKDSGINTRVEMFNKDENNILWVATNNGIHKISSDGSRLSTLTKKDGLIDDNITAILPDGTSLWMGTFNGLVQLDKNNGKINTFLEKDGLPFTEFNYKSYLKTSDGDLFFGGVGGLVRVNPSLIKKRSLISNIKLVDIDNYVLQKKKDANNIIDLDRITSIKLPYNHNYTTLTFAVDDIFNAEENKYQYQISGLSKDWIDLGSYNKIQLNEIKPGKYTLLVRGFDSFGNESNTLSYQLVASRVFYKTTWFIMSMTLLLVSGIFLFFKYKEQQQKAKYIQKTAILKLQTIEISERKKTEAAIRKYAKKLENKNKELEQFTYITSHDLQEPLGSIISLTEILTNEHIDQLDNEGQNILSFLKKSTGRMKELIKALLDYSLIGQHLKLEEFDCNDLVGTIVKNLEVSSPLFQFDIQVDKLPVLFGYKMELYLLFQNLIDNALKFRKKEGILMIKISCNKTEQNVWKFCVEDNGIGLDMRFKDKIFTIFQKLDSKEEYSGIGIGLSFCKKIVDLYNGDIYVESKLGKGSKFYFTINSETLK